MSTESRLDTLEQKLLSMGDRNAIFRTQAPGGFDLDRIPGQRRPHWINVDKAFLQSATSSSDQDSESVSDGSFVVTHLMAYWLPTSTTNADYDPSGVAANFTGRRLPVSAYGVIPNNVGAALSTALGYMAAIPEFDFKLTAAGTARGFMNFPIPGACLGGVNLEPFELPVPAWINMRDSMTVSFVPARAVPYEGTCRVVLVGYKIMGCESIDTAINNLFTAK